MESKIKLLIVDDEQKNINILLEILEFEEQYTIQSALSGDDCLAMIPDFSPDILLLDLMMPGTDGYEVCRQVRDNPAYNSMKIVILSGRAMQDEIARGLAMGADNYLSKPFGMNELLETLKKL